jgi:hypothetical protein
LPLLRILGVRFGVGIVIGGTIGVGGLGAGYALYRIARHR